MSEVREVARALGGGEGHVSIEIAADRVFCDVYYSGSHGLSYLVTALHLATGERFRHEGTFPSTIPRRDPLLT